MAEQLKKHQRIKLILVRVRTGPTCKPEAGGHWHTQAGATTAEWGGGQASVGNHGTRSI